MYKKTYAYNEHIIIRKMSAVQLPGVSGKGRGMLYVLVT